MVKVLRSWGVPLLTLGQVLLDNDADVDILTPADSTAFHVCCLHGQLELAQILIEVCMPPN